MTTIRWHSWHLLLSSVFRHCEPTGPARSGRPDDKLREAIQHCGAALDCFVAPLLAMTKDYFDISAAATLPGRITPQPTRNGGSRPCTGRGKVRGTSGIRSGN